MPIRIKAKDFTDSDIITLGEILADPDDIISKLAIREMRHGLDILLEKLIPQNAEILILFLSGLKPKQIGKLIGISSNVVSQRLFRIKMKAKEWYNEIKRGGSHG